MSWFIAGSAVFFIFGIIAYVLNRLGQKKNLNESTNRDSTRTFHDSVRLSEIQRAEDENLLAQN